MKITAGKYRGRNIFLPKGKFPTRPAMSVMREALFSMLGDVRGAVWADIFCGSGVMGIEALSRGASKVSFVDADRSKKLDIIKNLQWVEETYDFFFMDALRFLRVSKEKYDFIYLDPPFTFPNKNQLLQQAERLLRKRNERGKIIIHYPKKETLSIPNELQTLKKRNYSGSQLEIFQLSSVISENIGSLNSERFIGES